MQTKTNRKNALIRQFHAVCTSNGIDTGNKQSIIKSYGKDSIKDMSEKDIESIIKKLTGTPDTWRKRVMASVGSYLRAINMDENSRAIKAIACRASGYDNFNKIPVSRLRDVYYEFTRKAKTIKNTASVITGIETNISNLN